MPNKTEEQYWEEYRERELAALLPILTSLGYTLDTEQPHLYGERYLMHAVTTASGKKLILLGKRGGGKRVVIKATRDPAGTRELLHERTCRAVLQKINFAYDVFFSPEEMLFGEHGGYTISIQAFIEQKQQFIERPIEEQFLLALKAFKAQESAHAATYRHIRLIENTFGTMDAEAYLTKFEQFGGSPEAKEFLKAKKETIEQYCGFLTHTDFVPHNFRVVDGDMYLLDYSSLRFGNKYEGWARFLNFMTLYNPPLERALVQYVRDNRAEEELLSLKCMRVYRLGEIIWYYKNAASKSQGDLRTLNEKRVDFWSEVLTSVLRDKELPEQTRTAYIAARDTLRSAEEKQRQVGLH